MIYKELEKGIKSLDKGEKYSKYVWKKKLD